MIVQCPSCEARYRIGTENVPEQGGKISCPSCAQSFIVYPDVPDINNDETRAGGVPFVLQNAMEPQIEDGTVEIQNPMKTWLEAQKNLQANELEDAATSILTVNDMDLPFDNFSTDGSEAMDDDKTEMINLGDFLEVENSEVEYEATEVFTLSDHEAEQAGISVPKPMVSKPTLMGHQGLLAPAALPPLGGGLPPLKPSLPPISSLPQPSALPPISSLPPLQQSPALPSFQPASPSIEPAILPPMVQGSLAPPMLSGQPASTNPTAAPIQDLGVGQQNVQTDPNFNGPWKLRTNFGLTYEFPDTVSLNSWISSRDDVNGYTLAGNGDFYPLSYFPQIRPKHAGTSGSFSMHQPAALPTSDFLNQAPMHQPNAQPINNAPLPQPNAQPQQFGFANASSEIPMLQQPTDYKTFSKSDTNIPQKSGGGILPLLAWVFCGFSALVMVVTALYVFGIIGGSSLGLSISVNYF